MSRYSHLYSRGDGPLHRQPSNPRVVRSMTVPANAVPCVKTLFALMKSESRSYDDVAEASGLLRLTLKSWRHRSSPTYSSIEAAFGALGWSFMPCPRIEVLPDDFAADLARLAARMKATMPEVFCAMLDLAADQAFLRERAKERIEAREAEREALRNTRNTSRRRKPKTHANDNAEQAKSAA